MQIHPDIDRRVEDKQHTTAMDHMYSRTRIQKTNTKKQGMRIPASLLPEAILSTEAYKIYDEAQRIDKVGLTETKKGKTSKAAAKIKTIPKSRTKKVTIQPKKKVCTLRDEPTDDEGDVQKETETEKLTLTKKKKTDKGKAKET